MTTTTNEGSFARDVGELDRLIELIANHVLKQQKETDWDFKRDIRFTMFHQLQSLVETFKFAIYFSDIDPFWTEYLAKLAPLEDLERIENARTMYFRVTRNSYFCSLMSVLESVLRTLTRELAKKPGNDILSEVSIGV